MEENRENPIEETTGEAPAESDAGTEGDGLLVEAARALGTVAGRVAAVIGGAGETDAAAPAATGPTHRRQEKVGLVTSDKMEKTVVVRVERQVRHPKYKRYIRRRSKFMAHNELEAHIGDIVRIAETRPLSARKRWRVVEIVQKAR
ncbi:MAG TPA: 30S ribosomal protein S17 [Blastocatellia bacterium]|jgi:small subunit ribosomal protein S17|nr:30S ribosomal protein S17 [Blastocatellia bacterium]